ncbi:MAG: hypothetical protein ACR2PZ_21965 [Pseudomonadales bacterium]
MGATLIRASAILLLVAGCATTPSPEEICSAQWIKPRVDIAVADFRDDIEQTMSRLRSSEENATKSEGMGLLQGAAVLLSLTRLVNNLQDSRTLADLNTLSQTCNDPELAINALTEVLEEYEVPQPFVDLLRELDAFRLFVEESGTTQT